MARTNRSRRSFRWGYDDVDIVIVSSVIPGVVEAHAIVSAAADTAAAVRAFTAAERADNQQTETQRLGQWSQQVHDQRPPFISSSLHSITPTSAPVGSATMAILPFKS